MCFQIQHWIHHNWKEMVVLISSISSEKLMLLVCYDPGERYSKMAMLTLNCLRNSISSYLASLVQHSSTEHQYRIVHKSGHISFCICGEAALSSTISYSWAVGSVTLNVHEDQLICYLFLKALQSHYFMEVTI